MHHAARFGALVCALLALPLVAHASPWTLPQGTLSLHTSSDIQYADSEFLITGERYPFSLDGRFYAANIRGEVRYGLQDRFEIGGSLSAGVLSYQADEAYLGDVFTTEVGEEGSAERFRANILSLDRTTAGLGDLRIFARNRLTGLGRAVVATEVVVKLPTGYTPPDGTFEDDEFSEGVSDDVSLGDGQTDIDAKLLFGFVPTRDWFMRLDAGFRLRLFGPGQQVIGTFKTGYRVSPTLLPYVWVDATHSVTEGEVIGTSFTTDVPNTPAREFTADLLVPTDVRLDRSYVTPGVGVLFALGGREIDLSYSYVVWGENIAQLHVVSIGTTFTL